MIQKEIEGQNTNLPKYNKILLNTYKGRTILVPEVTFNNDYNQTAFLV